jgi:hypothetical protein
MPNKWSVAKGWLRVLHRFSRIWNKVNMILYSVSRRQSSRGVPPRRLEETSVSYFNFTHPLRKTHQFHL